MKIKWTNTYTKWSITFLCVVILACSVLKDMSFSDVCAESKSQNDKKDSILIVKVNKLDSLLNNVETIADSAYMHFEMIDATLLQHIFAVESTESVQNRMLYQINRKLNQ